MKTTYKISFFLLVLSVTAVTFWACTRTVKNGEILGNAQLVPAPNGFSGIIVNPGPVTRVWNPAKPAYHTKLTTDPSFSGFRFGLGTPDKLYFETQFSDKVTWYVNFVGATSGATKAYTGTSNTLDTSLVFWDGRADGFRFFVSGETVNYTISFLGSSLTYTGSVVIYNDADLGPVNYNFRTRKLPNGSTLRYHIIDNFEKGGSITSSYSDAADGIGAARFFITDQKQVSGHFSFYMTGTDVNGNSYNGGSSDQLTELQNYTTVTDPTKIYFNVYIYGYGRSGSALFLQAFENDFATPPIFPTPRLVNQNDMWYSIIQVDWVGWKLVSVPYSSFKPANNPNSGGGGNRIKEPHKLCGFGIELDSYPTAGQTIELAIDDVYMTENGPFQP